MKLEAASPAQQIQVADGAAKLIMLDGVKTEPQLVRPSEIALQPEIHGNMEPAPLPLAIQLAFMVLVFVENVNVYWYMVVPLAIRPSVETEFWDLESKLTYAVSVVDLEPHVWVVMELLLDPNTTIAGSAEALALLVTIYVEIMTVVLALMQQRVASGAIHRKNVCANKTSVCAPKALESPLIAQLHY